MAGNKYTKEEMKTFFNSIPKDVLEEGNRKQLEKTDEDYKEFTNAMDNNKCSLCGRSLKYFNKNEACLHWLLKPKGANKKRILEMLTCGKFGFFQVQSYIRWVGNYDKILGNINTLQDEKDPKKLFEITVKYKDFTWTMNYSQSDFEGHKGTKTDFPHYHFAMRVKDLPFIDFSNSHIPFTDPDLFNITALDAGVMASLPTYGAGLQDLFDNIDPEDIINSATSSSNKEEGVMNFSTFIEADEGETIKSEDIEKILKEHNETGVPLAKLVKKLKCKTTTIISPGERIPDILHRSKRNR